jgi:hypothetical protein
MMRIAISVVSSFLIVGGLLAHSRSFAVDQYAGGTPTAPQPPMASKTSLPPTNTRVPPQRPTNTVTRYVPPTKRVSTTPTSTLAPVITETQTPTVPSINTPTKTLTPTLTQTLTPTPFLNLRIVVYLDLNKDNIFEFGEGVNDLLVLVTTGSWKEQIILQDGEAWLALPPGLPSGSDVQVQSPYLHWSKILQAPKSGEIVEANLKLDLPQYPVSLP